MGGDQKTTSTQKSTQNPYGPAQKPIDKLLKRAGDIKPISVPGAQGFANNLLAGGQTGLDTLNKTAGGGFLDQGNPYLQGILGTLNEQARNAVGGEFANAGRSVGGQYENALVKALTQSQAPYLFNNYQFERGAQNNAASTLATGAPGLVNQTAGLPYAGLNPLANLLLPIAGIGGTSTGTGTQSQAGDPLQQGIGAGVGTLGLLGNTGAFGSAGWLSSMLPFAAASDRRLKEDIEQVGELFDGTPVYRFRYKGQPMTVIGLMADDVEQYTPEAVITNDDGFKFVDYKLATERALTQ